MAITGDGQLSEKDDADSKEFIPPKDKARDIHTFADPVTVNGILTDEFSTLSRFFESSASCCSDCG
jgi:hypothetical protein